MKTNAVSQLHSQLKQRCSNNSSSSSSTRGFLFIRSRELLLVYFFLPSSFPTCSRSHLSFSLPAAAAAAGVRERPWRQRQEREGERELRPRSLKVARPSARYTRGRCPARLHPPLRIFPVPIFWVTQSRGIKVINARVIRERAFFSITRALLKEPGSGWLSGIAFCGIV